MQKQTKLAELSQTYSVVQEKVPPGNLLARGHAFFHDSLFCSGTSGQALIQGLAPGLCKPPAFSRLPAEQMNAARDSVVRLPRLATVLILAILHGLIAGDKLLAQAVTITQLNAASTWQRVEFQLNNVPAAANPFDPTQIRVDAIFTAPSGSTNAVPAFWFQGYTRSLSGGYEQLTASGAPTWRVRFTPREAGTYSIALAITTNGISAGTPVATNFSVTALAGAGRTGYVQLATNHQFFQTGDGTALRLIGHNVAWPGSRVTYDYDDWFAAMQAAGENYARIWMCPWAFGIEAEQGTLTNYRLDRAWQLDYIFQLAEQRGIYLLLCLDYHGMFQTIPDSWGGNDAWKTNPYNATNGGPCAVPNAFFTNTTARVVYEKRLRYLAGRYGSSPNLLAWEFFNEIDNAYYNLNATDVASWHQALASWMRTNDPFNHLLTTSLTGNSDRPEIWQIPQLDFASYHSYNEAQPASRLATVAQSFLSRYAKPVMIGEFGTSSSSWNRTNDPYLRGLRQALWGGAIGGSTGTAMSWWWENIHSENVYPLFTALGRVLNRTGWGIGAWSAIGFPDSQPPVLVGDPIDGGVPFTAQLPLGGAWGGMPLGAFALTSPDVAGNAANYLNSFIHGVWHSDLKRPFKINAWLTNNARIVLHLNSVSDGAQLKVLVDGSSVFSTNLPNLDGGYSVNNEYNLDIPVNLPSGKRFIEVTNAGTDWVYLDWVRFEQVLPSSYAGGWQPAPAVIGGRGPRESLLYVIAPNASYPGSATNVTLPLQHGLTVTLTNWPPGDFFGEWYNCSNGVAAGFTHAVTTNGTLTLPVPDFREDLAAIVYAPPVLSASAGFSSSNSFGLQLTSETGGRYDIQRSMDLTSWTPLVTVTNTSGMMIIHDPAATNRSANYRAVGSR
jgi:Domain of unknown function (DUF5060)/Cellulase (glycosyl hydrolase family 5)